jgi:hypothetical protein
MAAERTRLEAAAERSHAERKELSGRIDTTAAERSALQRAHDDASARAATLENELRTVREQELAAAQSALTAEREARRLSEEAFAAAEARYQEETSELRDRLAVFTHEQTRLAKELEEKDLLLQSAEDDLTAAIDLSVDGSDDDSVLDIDRDYAPESSGSPASDVLAEVEAAAGGDCILLDDEQVGSAAVLRLAEFGHRVSALAPTGGHRYLQGSAGRLRGRQPAAPNTWAMLRHLRGSGIPPCRSSPMPSPPARRRGSGSVPSTSPCCLSRRPTSPRCSAAWSPTRSASSR